LDQTSAGGGVRFVWWVILGGASVALLTASFPLWNLPTWWFCFAPLLWLWGTGSDSVSGYRVAVEAFVIGFIISWLPTAFMREVVPAGGCYLQAAFCLFYALQMIALAFAIRFFRGKPVMISALCLSATAMLAEILQYRFGLAWPVTAICLPVASTPLAQWAAVITPFGVSGLLYLINFLLVIDPTKQGLMKWRGPGAALLLFVCAWSGGLLISRAVVVTPLPFSAILVQPHLVHSEGENWTGWRDLDRLTDEALSNTSPVDLIIWPEACLSLSKMPEGSFTPISSPRSLNAAVFSVQDFAQILLPKYQTSCLVGVPLSQRRMITRYGLEMPESRLFNSACLISPEGKVSVYSKRLLVPVKEGLPDWLDTAFVRQKMKSLFGWNPRLSAGENFHLLDLKTKNDKTKKLAVAVCYELFLPGLPQYRQTSGADAVVYLMYDGIIADHPAWSQRLLQACRYRAIESRKWNLCCTTWAGSAIIDARGNVVNQLESVGIGCRSFTS